TKPPPRSKISASPPTPIRREGGSTTERPFTVKMSRLIFRLSRIASPQNDDCRVVVENRFALARQHKEFSPHRIGISKDQLIGPERLERAGETRSSVGGDDNRLDHRRRDARLDGECRRIAVDERVAE